MDSAVENIKAVQIDNELGRHIDGVLHSLQKARLDRRKNTTLEDLFRHRNPYFLRSTRKAAWKLMQYCLDNYLLSVDEILFAEFASEISAYSTHRGQKLPESGAMLDLSPLDALPLRFELEEEYGRLYNRLTYRFFEELCDEESRVDWEKLTRFISQCESIEISQQADGDSAQQLTL